MADEERKPYDPALVMEQYSAGAAYKAALGSRGLYEQSKVNERFYVGDQWYGVNAGNDRPLVRHNVIKRIGDYKMAVVGSNPVTVNYSAEGVPNTVELQERVRPLRDRAARGGAVSIGGGQGAAIPTDVEINLVMSALSDYFRVTAERLRFEDIKEQALRNAYVSGTGVVYTWWDDTVRTGLYADEARRTPVRGDIACEVLDIENVYFGDPNMDDIQNQPYILIAQRKNVADIRREARRYRSARDAGRIAADKETQYEAGERSEQEADDARKAVVITKLWKEWNEDGSDYTVKGVKVCNSVTVRGEWELGVRLYPLAKFQWERRRGCAYGESEITYLIPNQIAINRMLTASVWAVMVMGMPIMVVNNDIVQAPVTNDPGQIIPVAGEADAVDAIRYLNPPQFSPNFDQNISSLISNTLTQAGANDAALGDIRPDNASAIIAVREAATMPMQMVQNRYYAFCEEIARIWAEFWMMKYGKRALKIEDETGTWYLPFDGERYKELLISTKVEVGASTLWSESQSIRTLDSLFDRQVIDVVQYLSRLPKGTVPGVNGLIRELQAANASLPGAAKQTPAQGGTAAGPRGGSGEEREGADVPAQALPEPLRAALYNAVMNMRAEEAARPPQADA